RTHSPNRSPSGCAGRCPCLPQRRGATHDSPRPDIWAPRPRRCCDGRFAATGGMTATATRQGRSAWKKRRAKLSLRPPGFTCLRPSAAAESTASAKAGFLPLAEEGLVVHRLLVRMFLQHVPDVVVVVRDPAAQPRGLDQPPPHPLVRGVVGDGDELGTHGVLLTGGPARPAAPR